MGDKSVKVNKFNGLAVPNQTLSMSFSIDSFVTTLTRLTSLRVLSLVSLGIWGPLPDKIHRLSLLEVLDLSSNFLFGSIPPRIATMVKLHTLTLDGNYFNSTMPNWFDSLSNLNVLSLKSNHLKGSFPSSLCKIKSLTDISLSHNELSGGLPDLTALSGLHVLDLRENHLDSELPLMPKTVVTILLSENSFSGEIPSQFGELGQLQHLDLSSNHLSRMPPSALFSLPNISYLNLASNLLSGSLPHKLKCGSKLGFVDISSNKLNGVLPSCLSSTSDRRVVRYGGNCLSADSQAQKRGSYCKESSSERMKFWRWKIAAAVATIIVVVLVLSAFGVFFYRQYHSRETYRHEMLPKIVQDNSTTGVSSEILASARFISQTVKLGTQATPTCRQFPIEELKEITRNFDLSTYIGEGSIGKLYKGKLENGSYIVIRSLALKKKFSLQNLKARNQLKTNNVLLDEHHIPKLSDYGMSMIAEEIENPEAKRENPKSCQREELEDDVYNFGFILFESLAGPIASEKGEAFFLDEKASFGSQDGRKKIVDPVVLTTCCQESLSIAISITTKCISPESSSRPSFEDVLWNLQYAAQVQATADADSTC
ncbi:Protein kinase-like domain superfamily [Sesbania bispinosa]|nr:Protein kinase-like domain superfamily [Sesbania bispinosa]